MPRYDFAARRLYVTAPLAEAATINLDQTQANYVRNVLRLPEGAKILAFNGRDGEWETSVAPTARKTVTLVVEKKTRPQDPQPGLQYLFAPLKHARHDYMIEKAVEMGAGLLRPVLTRRTQITRINSDRMRAHAIEAAEQCGILSIADIAPAIRLDALVAAWEKDRLLVFCDEIAPLHDPYEILRSCRSPAIPRKLAVLIGPEGGFDQSERETLLRLPHVVRLPLGPRVLRADTAAVAALALIQAALGDWQE
ncbi:MAG: 16S rRNA (uracil(1498)-N(3))-methyltransferase [Beijerinckiaceae bacterium]|nr:16S rRNA (uracil(1498)-N(3))-methyltransferase [Beijerinckiaceae bacterium]MCI0736850.1 16S rRNA (uracil(1498)-N(3))-methyltransferase [Beijerinckiaceae bacterium]